MHVTLLGTNGWIPSDRRATTCVATRLDDTLFVFDAGTGLRRLLSPKHASLLEDATEVHLFLSHFHLDHTCGLAYLSGVFPGRRVTIHAPEQAITGVDPEAAVAGILHKPYNPTNWEDLRDVRLEPLSAGPNEVAGHVVRLRPQKHSDLSVAHRVDDEFVIATDTAADPETADFAAGVGLLLHESWYWAEDPALGRVPDELKAGYASHSEAAAVAGLAAGAGVDRLIFIHLNPLSSEDSYVPMQQAAGVVFPHTEVCPDGTVLSTARD